MSKAPINLNDKVDKEAELGTLIVVLLKARNLNDKHSFRKSDVFAQATLNGTQKRTEIDIKGGQHPEWDGEVRFPIMKSVAAKHRKLEVECYSAEPRSEDLMGKGVVDISETLRTGEFDDWVTLEIDGVQRGELYLEMTYYANAPAPVHQAAAPNKFLSAVQNQNNGLNRRPSKFSPAERLSRPPAGRSEGQTTAQSYANAHARSPPSSNLPPRAAYSSRLDEQYTPQSPAYSPPSSKSTLPSIHSSRLNEPYAPLSPGGNPHALPASLIPNHPGGSPPKGRHDTLPATDPYRSHSRPGPQGPGAAQPPQATLPTILRPGPGAASPPSTSAGPLAIPHPQQNEFGHGRNPSASPPSNLNNSNRHGTLPQGPPNPYIGAIVSPPNPYIGGSTAPASSIGGPGLIQTPYTYGPPSSGAPLLWRQDHAGGAPSNGSFSFPTPLVSPTHQRQPSYGYDQQRPPPRDDRLGDPYLQARYQTPLPLPPGASSPHKAPTPVSTHAPAPAPVATRIPTTPPHKASTPAPDRARLEALRRAEDDAKRRREQELKDLELAMELDRQLNIAENNASSSGRPTATAMPGGW